MLLLMQNRQRIRKWLDQQKCQVLLLISLAQAKSLEWVRAMLLLLREVLQLAKEWR